MYVLSTNCAYYNAYMIVYRLTNEQVYLTKAEELKSSMLLYGIAGLKHKKGHIEFKPYLPFAIDYIEI